MTPADANAPTTDDPNQLAGDASERLATIVELMRTLSRQTDPQEMVRYYRRQMSAMMPTDRALSLSRRGLNAPFVRITRYSGWPDDVNPWKQPEKLPLLEGGLLADLIHGDEPRIINDLDIDPSDPAFPYLEGMKSLLALPLYDGGEALNMALALDARPGLFDPEILPDRVWMSNLFGRATSNLVLKEQIREAFEFVERELKIVADIQHSLLPQSMPEIPGLSLAAFYQASRWAGGDYYDFFPLPDGRWGLLIADVSGHGTPAAVLMAVLHAIAHGHPDAPDPPSAFLRHINDRLVARYTADNESFVTAFYGVFDPARRTFTYASAGHNPPLIKRCMDGSIRELSGRGGLPLGLFPDQDFPESTYFLTPGDQIVLYTDGITEALDPDSAQFGTERLEQALGHCRNDADALIAAVLESLTAFARGRAPVDDQTLLVAKIL
jgi:sigma-B regulation protein RsbU (phosphoserine phosphatase)